ncbi:bifunctional DNA-formamidopyrimidine glycosylase/DNA-(apurinic or apyrimidinic site) lyase [Luteipulveratus flavus]|uniref:Formamidopyrimidine-DNA glycosylase n=1 Tax=Luteipulveratus flavus TaxID=3031728 RepID=A0ABT6C5F2_9MICO|nr:bifunctional DNA-formamidopyrimidine glycosylase/DNA-(apurinic or apyrimidinic site) lyase [Luteipulveratus sp. YIM 133296]MDF8263788.1 bifunctional DNA-formamidopyrimidine glycosylase/DNA-(apurinic or apyrimidinic site) lyase [Luteipulveratus sp. YIM 133296]
MPELPEVEVVRRGLADHVVGRSVVAVDIRGHRVARRHLAGPLDLADRLTGTTVVAARRRGKYLWLELADHAAGHGDPDETALIAHLGMSGQMLVEPADAPLEKHAHAVLALRDPDGSEGLHLRFVDQRTFGGLYLDDLVTDTFAGADALIPSTLAHIAPDPLETAYDQASVVRRMKARHTQIKRALLDQSLVSGIGNIYADEALWRARLHGERMTDALTKPVLSALLDHARDVMGEALGKGGTSFDALYVNVNGASGYFERSLNAYGREGEPCRRCGRPMRREAFMNRSSFSCPRCQPRPRTVRRTATSPATSSGVRRSVRG